LKALAWQGLFLCPFDFRLTHQSVLWIGGYWLYRSFSQAIHGLLRGENQVHLPGEPLTDFLNPLKANTHLSVSSLVIFSISISGTHGTIILHSGDVIIIPDPTIKL